MRSSIKLSEKDKSKLRGLVISQLDLQSDERQAEAMGYAIDAYLSNKIDRLMLVGIISELKNINPLLFYFSEYNLYIDNGHTVYGRPYNKRFCASTPRNILFCYDRG